MVYIKLWADTPYCGTSDVEYHRFEEMDPDMFDAIAEKFGTANAESYEHLAESDIDPDAFATEDDYDIACAEAREEFWDDCSYGWEVVSEEEYKDYEG